ncbi:MAG: hypothetical protein WA771_16080 [Chthoniobacterales bacterium]
MSEEVTDLISQHPIHEPETSKPESKVEHAKTVAKDAYATGKDQVSKAAKDIGDAANAKYADLKTQAAAQGEVYKGKAQDAFNEAQAKAKSVQSDTEQYVRENPLQAVGCALGAGFLIGLILRK